MNIIEFIINNYSDISKFPFIEISEVRLYDLFDEEFHNYLRGI